MSWFCPGSAGSAMRVLVLLAMRVLVLLLRVLGQLPGSAGSEGTMMDAFQLGDLDRALCLLRLLRKRPASFIFPITPQSLSNFLSGYVFSETQRGSPSIFNARSCDFQTWLGQRLNVSFLPSMSWSEEIARISEDEESAVQVYIDLLEEYLRESVTPSTPLGDGGTEL